MTKVVIKKQPSKKGKLYIENVIALPPVRSVSFAEAYPEAAAQWDYAKNCGFKPEDFSHGSNTFCWFKCPAGADHFYQAQLFTVARAYKDNTWNKACGFCRGLKPSVTNSVAEQFPELISEWVKSLNDRTPYELSYGSNQMVWWRCKKRHMWQAVIANRTIGQSGCPRCNRGAPTDLRDFPEALAEFDHANNPGVNPHALPVGLKVNWQCATDASHKSWRSGFYRTTTGIRCPSCANKIGSASNNLKITHPQFAQQWDYKKNDKLKPTMVTASSNKRVHWKCKMGPDHEWSCKIVDRTKDMTRCPFCSFRKTSATNVITTLAPHLAKEWHPTKNGDVLPQNERARSHTERWWLCDTCTHVWRASPKRRIATGSGCPHCYHLLKYPYFGG